MASSDEETPECRVCLEDLRHASGSIQQCPVGHLECFVCFVRLGGVASSCPVCQRTMGNIRNGYLEGMRDRYQARCRASQSAGRASPPASVQQQVLSLPQMQLAAAATRSERASAAKQQEGKKEAQLKREAEEEKRWEEEAVREKEAARERERQRARKKEETRRQEEEARERERQRAQEEAMRLRRRHRAQEDAQARQREEKVANKKAAGRWMEGTASKKKQQAPEAADSLEERRRAAANRNEEAAPSQRREQEEEAKRREEEAVKQMRKAEDRAKAARQRREMARMCKMICPLIILLIVATTWQTYVCVTVWEKKTGKDLTVGDNWEKIAAVTTAARMRVFGGLLTAMQEGEERVEVQVQGCSALWSLVADEKADHADFRRTIVELPGAVGVIVASMRAHQASAEVQVPCCGVLLNLAKNPDNQRTIVEAGGVEVIVAGMRSHAHDVRVQEEGCGALARLALNNAHNRRTIAKAGGVEVIVAGLRTHAHDARVQEEGCGALWTLAKDEHIRSTIAKAMASMSVICLTKVTKGEDWREA